ncbi:MAG TPA: hypothetical protein VHZ76_05495 [Gammaproteobacteria bacterium]|jgi:hypothetical protein|nr:hypothetical protein [Gammaproteobacteria bacterium]
MSDYISYDTILDLLVGDEKSEESLVIVLNFLQYTEILIRRLYWVQKSKEDLNADSNSLGFLGFKNDE